MQEKKSYLDTSGLVKRYVKEKGTEFIDAIFNSAEEGSDIICFSEWNLGESSVVFDKYQRMLGIDARELLGHMLNEVMEMSNAGEIEIVPVSSNLVLTSINYVLKHHIYVSDALQLSSFRATGCNLFVTADRELHEVALSEDINSKLV